MEVSLRSRIANLRRLWFLLPKVFGSGIPRRPGLLKLIFGPSHQEFNFNPAGHLVLLDANENKVRHAEREFGEPCFRVDVTRCPLRLRARIHLFLCVLVPGRLGTIIACMVLARNLRHVLPSGSRVALYNPYFLVQYVAAEYFVVEKVFHLAADYPRVESARHVFACAAVHQILGYRVEQRRFTLQPHSVAEDIPVVRVYLTQILGLVTYREESSLIDFARWLRSRSDVRVEIFLHYVDRDIEETDPRSRSLFEDFGTSVRRDDSLQTLSACQISFSALSTIGYDLLSSDICHVVVFNPDRHETLVPVSDRLESWRAERADVIAYDTPYLGWLQAAFDVDKASFEAVFGCLPSGV